MKKVLLAQPINSTATEELKQYAEILQIREGNLDEFKQKLPEANAVVLGTSIKFTGELMDLAHQLKVISRTGAGVDNVDIKAATQRGICVLNTPEANSLSVAEHTLMMICALAKCTVFLDDQVRGNNFGARRLYLPVDLQGKVLGLVGCGRIGTMVARKCINAFDMKVLAYDPVVKTAEDGITLVQSIEKVFRDADFVSLHVPLIESTYNLVGERLLKLMKSSAFLINTSRGGIVDEAALALWLKEKKISGAALDVFFKEPPEASSELLNLPNIILTPHTAALTQECTARVAMEAVNGVIDFLEGRIPRFVYNQEVLK